MLASRFWVALGFITCVSVAATRADESAAVEEVAVEKAEHDIYFRASVKWPAENVPGQYQEFLNKSGEHRTYRGLGWPDHSIALIPQGTGAALVCREYFTQDSRPEEQLVPSMAKAGVSTPVVFVGKLREQNAQEFLLRCPSPEGKWLYLPVKIDFAKAKKGEGLAKEWLQAQADFMQIVESSADQSFFSYARNKLLGRLGKPLADESIRIGISSQGGRERLYEITTGALALQESLQLDRMRNPTADSGARDIAIDQIEEVKVKSHPWEEMIGGRKPEIEPIAGLVPANQYYVRFKTSRSLVDYLDFVNSWGGSVLSQVEIAGRDYRVKEKIENQICLKSSWLSNLLGPAVIENLAITGSDPYLREGSDISVIFQLKAAPVFEAAANKYIAEARSGHSDLQEGKEEFGGATIQSLTTPDLAVRCYRVRLDDYYVYSNSPAAIRRIINTHREKLPSLAKSLDFVYMRTIYPLKASEEDGFLFLSDPFIRTLVGARTRIGEKRRIEAVTSLEMVKNAAMMYAWENPGAKPASLEKLYNDGYLDAKSVVTEPGDHIQWDPAAFTASSERYGRVGYLTPIIEMEPDKITAKEKADYEQFRTRYQEYWRRYFDPIGIRITAGRDLSMSLTILPLIDDTEYKQIAVHFGGKAVTLEPVKRTGPVVMHFAAHLNPDSPELKQVQTMALNMMPGNQPAAVEWIGERVEFWIEDSDALNSVYRNQEYGKIFEIPMVLAVEVKSPLGLAAFLIGLQPLIQTSAPNTLVFEQTEAYKGLIFTRVRPAPGGMLSNQNEFAKAALYYGKVGDYLYLSTSLETLHQIVDGNASTTKPGDNAGQAASKPVGSSDTGHMSLRFSVEQAKKSRAALLYYLGAWEVERTHMQNLWLVAHTVGFGPTAVPPERVLGFAIDSALGNTYKYDAGHDEIVGSVTGSSWNTVSQKDFPEQSPFIRLFNSLVGVGARLTLTKDGLRTDLTIQRSGK